MSIIDATLSRFKLCVGANPLALDRLFIGGDKETMAFFIALSRERAEMTEALDVAAFTMEQMQIELEELREDKKAQGTSAMELGEKRK